MSEPPQRRFLSWRLIGPIAVIGAIWYAGPATIWGILSGADLTLVVGALALAVPLALVKGLRWKILLEGQGARIGFRESTSMYALGMVMAAITPGRVGEAIKILPLRERGFSVGQAVAYTVLDRLFDLAFVLLAGCAGMWYFFGYVALRGTAVPMAGAAGLVLAAVVFSRRPVLRFLAARLIPERHRPAVRQCWNEIVGSLFGGSLKRSATLVAATVVSWLMWFLAVHVCAAAIGLNVPFLYLCGCVAVATVMSFLPITVAGAGTRDATFVLLLGRLGIAQHEALAFSSLVLAVFVSNSAVFYLLAVLLGAPPARAVSPAGPISAPAEESECRL